MIELLITAGAILFSKLTEQKRPVEAVQHGGSDNIDTNQFFNSNDPNMLLLADIYTRLSNAQKTV